MFRALAAIALLALAAPVFADAAGGRALTCADLRWSAEVMAKNPDIARACRGVYQRDGRLYAMAQIEVLRARGNHITFRPLYSDGSRGESRGLTVPSGFRISAGGREFRVQDLRRGQVLEVFLPDDRFALALPDSDGPDKGDFFRIEE